MARESLTHAQAAPEIFGAGDGGVRIDLPPGFELVALREGFEAFTYAQEIASRRGAGTLVFTRRFDLVEFAIVLEPEEPLVSARRAFYLCMNAMADSLAVHCPPEKPIRFDWPDAMLFDHGLIGGGRLAWPEGTADDQVPDWLVFGGMMRTAVIRNRDSNVSLEPGSWQTGTALEVEGFEEILPENLVASFCRHLMVQFDTLSEKGFRRVGRDYLDRLEPDKTAKRGIDGNGDFVLNAVGKTEATDRQSLIAALDRHAWFDRETREPKL
jgi:hypothetical protein